VELRRQAAEVGERERFAFRPASPGERKKALSVLDGFENLFYERMAREIKRGERGT